jgi:hypothetical protein
MHPEALRRSERDFRFTGVPAGSNREQNRQQDSIRAVRSGLGLAGTEQNAHQQRQIAGRRLQQQQLLVNVDATSKVQPFILPVLN